MNSNEIKSLIKKTEDMVSGFFITGGEKWETVPFILKKLYQFGGELVDQTEKKEGLDRRIECNVGCPYCCYTRVTLMPCEALHIGQHIRENYSLRQTDALMKKMSQTLRLAKGISPGELPSFWRKTPCIFLENDKCSIYAIRPFLCRAWHSLSVDQCRRAFESDREDAEIDTTPFRGTIYGAVREGLTHVCRSMGCEWETTDILSSLRIVLAHPDPFTAWIRGENLFRP